MKSTRVLFGILPLALAAACSGSSDDDDGGSSVPLDDVPAAYSQAVCDTLTRCAEPLLEVFLVGEDCVANTTARLEEELSAWQAAIDDGRVEYHGDQVESCLADVRARACEDFNERGSGPCEQVFVGTTALGGDCTLDDECAGDAYCDFENACPGTCVELAGEGRSCNENDDCASGLTCSNATGACEQPGGAGDLCGMDNPDCGLGYLCAGANALMGEPGNCRSYDEVFAGAEGDACDILAFELCQTGLVCQVDAFGVDGIEASCAANVGSAAACRLAVPDQCPDDEYCDVPENMLEGTCRPRPAAGEACGGSDGNVCAAGARCNGGTCKALTELGGSCVTGDVCLSESCDGGQCVSRNSCE